MLLTHGLLSFDGRELAKAGHREYLVEVYNDAFRRAITRCEREVVQRRAFQELLESAFSEHFTMPERSEAVVASLLQALWRAGIFAYRSNDSSERPTWQFVWSSNVHDVSQLPDLASVFGFHSSMIDVCGLEVTNGPIY